MTMMPAYQIVEWGRRPEIVDVPVPVPGPGEVLVRMAGAGLCRSDLDIIDQAAGAEPYASVLDAGFTLGHENAGFVEAWGSGVHDLKEGDHVVVHHMQVCGFCDYCLHGHEQSCNTFARGSIPLTRGVGIDGGLARFLLVPRRELFPIGALDPVRVAPLTDAGVTSYRAVKTVTEKLFPGTHAVVIGLGGLGAYTLQFLKILSGARVLGVDVNAARIARAGEFGADMTFVFGDRTAEEIMDTTGGRGADVIIDNVGTDATLALAARISRPQGRIVLVGMEGGQLPVGWGRTATTCEFAISLGSKRSDLSEVSRLAAQGRLKIEIERFRFDEVETAYQRLREGTLNGRAVITFD